MEQQGSSVPRVQHPESLLETSEVEGSRWALVLGLESSVSQEL